MSDKAGVWTRWKELAARAATFQARVLLSIFYWTVIPPFALALRAFGDPLGLRRARGGRWTSAAPVDPGKQS